MAKRTTSTGIKQVEGVIEMSEGRKKRIIRIIAVSVIVLFLFNLATGVVSYGAVATWCLRPPVVGSKFAASWHYFRPGQPGYGPHAFAEYYCTEQDAKNAGFNPSSW